MKLTDFFMDIGRPVAYYPKLSHITGGVKETVFLCQLLYWYGRQEDEGGWIYKTQEEISEETGLSRYEQETARKNLKKKGFLEEKYAGMPRKLYYRVNTEAVSAAWEEYVRSQTIDGANNNVEIPQPSVRKSNMQACGNTADKSVETPHASVRDSNIPTSYTEITTETTTEITTENTTETTNQPTDGRTGRRPDSHQPGPVPDVGPDDLMEMSAEERLGVASQIETEDQVIEYYRCVIGELSPTQYEALATWMDEKGLSPSVIAAAISETAVGIAQGRVKSPWRYVNRILLEWYNARMRNLEDLRHSGRRRPSRSGPTSDKEIDPALIERIKRLRKEAGLD